MNKPAGLRSSAVLRATAGDAARAKQQSQRAQQHDVGRTAAASLAAALLVLTTGAPALAEEGLFAGMTGGSDACATTARA